jgi:hypothetical protein
MWLVKVKAALSLCLHEYSFPNKLMILDSPHMYMSLSEVRAIIKLFQLVQEDKFLNILHANRILVERTHTQTGTKGFTKCFKRRQGTGAQVLTLQF